MRMITMREFRNNFAAITEPVRVLRSRGNIEVIGTWTPEKPRPASTNGQPTGG